MHKLITTLATTATLVLAASIVEKAEAATMTQLGSLSPLAKSYTTIEKAGWRHRAYRRGYYGYGYPSYGYGYPTLSVLWLRLLSTLPLLWVWLWSWLRLALLGRPFHPRVEEPLSFVTLHGSHSVQRNGCATL